MTHKLFILGKASEKLWGLNPAERLQRQLRSLGENEIYQTIDDSTVNKKLVALSSDYIYDTSVIKSFLKEKNTLLLDPKGNRIVGINTSKGLSINLNDILLSLESEINHDLKTKNPHELGSYNDHLRKKDTTLLEAVNIKDLDSLERKLYGNAYKGITDLVTKFIWPKPARSTVKFLAERNITPNAVTLVSLLLVIAATMAFAEGYFGIGLFMGWIMTFLDTVDGKLARVTITSSKLGHVLDHGMDIIHPPFWYFAWYLGVLTLSQNIDSLFNTMVNATIFAYIIGRAIEAAFHALGNCSMFAWRPFDAYCRLITARRNPCLLILTGAWLCNSPKMGLLLVASWTIISSFMLTLRLCQATVIRLSNGPLQSWLKNEDIASKMYPKAYKTFSNTGKAYD